MSRKMKLTSARSRNRPGNFSAYFDHARAVIQPGDKVVICVRVSEHPQQVAGNLGDQGVNLRNEMHRLGAVVLGAVLEEWSGSDPVWIARAVAIAKQKGAKLLVFESVDRAIRTDTFHPFKRPEAQAEELDLKYLRYFTDGFPLATVLPPTAPPAEVRSYQRIRGQQAKGRCGGRPLSRKPGYLKRRRERLVARARQLFDSGYSLRQIEKEIRVPYRTVQDWLKRHD